MYESLDVARQIGGLRGGLLNTKANGRTGPAPWQLLHNIVQLHRQGDRPLSEIVMQLPGDPGALLSPERPSTSR